MKKSRITILSLGAVLVLSACTAAPASKDDSKEVISTPIGEVSSQSGDNSGTPGPVPAEGITLIEPEDTSMLTENCKAYVDAMREQEESLEEPFKYNALEGNDAVTVEDYLDQGDVNGKNSTVRNEIPDRSDKSMGVDLAFEVSDGFEADEYTVLVSDNEDFDDAIELKTTKNSVNVNNLFVNTEYYWKVIAGEEESEVGTFETGDYPRWITARPMYNVRDNGGYMTISGKRVKQGLVFRGGEITNRTWSEHLLTNAESSKKAFRDVMHIGVELDLRGASDIGDGYNACAFAENGDIIYAQHPIKSYEQTFTNTRSEVAPIFEILKEADEKPVYYHCYGGADRTGTIGFLLNGLLGVSYTDLLIDFELTSYSSINNEHIRNHMTGHQHQYDRWPALINQLKTDTTGGYAWDEDALLMDNIENFLVKACSVPQDTIDTIRDIMLED